MFKFSLTESESDTLRKTLDFACNKLSKRLKGTVMDDWDGLALTIAEEKVRLLRNKLFTEPL